MLNVSCCRVEWISIISTFLRACGHRSSRSLVCRRVEAVVEVGNVDVAIGSLVSARKCDLGAAGRRASSNTELHATNVELSAALGLCTVECQHLAAELYTGQSAMNDIKGPAARQESQGEEGVHTR